MAQSFQQDYDPFGDAFGNNQQKTTNNDFDSFFNDVQQNPSPKKDEFMDMFGSNTQQMNQAAPPQQNQQPSGQLFNEDDILNSFEGKPQQNQPKQLSIMPYENAQPIGNGFDQIFQATAEGSGTKPINRNKPTPTHSVPSYSTTQSLDQIDESLKGRNLANEAISSDRKKSYFQSFIFDSYKYQGYFNASTQDVMEKLYEALWPFNTKNQPQGLVTDYNNFCKKVFPKKPSQEAPSTITTSEGVQVHNPFGASNNDELSFIGRNLDEPEIQQINYQKNTLELYGPIWIFVTLLVEFIILGHMSNIMADSSKQKKDEIQHEMLTSLMKKQTADQALKRIMKITFFLAFFYFGNPFVTYMMFKSRNAFEVSFLYMLTIFSYAFVPLIPGSLVLFCLQQYSRFKLVYALAIWLIHMFYLYKGLYDVRSKYFDFQSNKQLAWFLVTSTFLFVWMYKSYFMQV